MNSEFRIQKKMPHLTLQCSQNVKLDHKKFFAELCEQLVATGHAPALGMKCRVERSDEYYIIDGSDEYKMANLLFGLREGRSDETLLNFSEIALQLMEKYFEEDCNETNIILSTEVRELKKGRDLTKNYIRKKFEKEK